MKERQSTFAAIFCCVPTTFGNDCRIKRFPVQEETCIISFGLLGAQCLISLAGGAK